MAGFGLILCLVLLLTFETTNGLVLLQRNETCTLLRDSQNFARKLICDAPDSIDSIPILSKEDSDSLYSIEIQNQSGLTQIEIDDLSPFKSLNELIIRNTGLSSIASKAFTKIRSLKKLDLRSNRLSSLDWRSVVNLREAVVDIRDNPLVCNCSLFWLASWSDLGKKRSFRSPDGTSFYISTADAMTLPKEILHSDSCQQEDGNERSIPLSAWKYTSITHQTRAGRQAMCSLPVVSMRPRTIRRSASIDSSSSTSPAEFQCSISSQQLLDLDFRQTFQLKVINALETRNRMKISRQNGGNSTSAVIINLAISNLSYGQMGWYVCVGFSVSGPSFDMASLVVASRPSINKITTQDRSVSGDHYVDTFDVNIHSFPPPLNFTWFKNNASINFTDGPEQYAFMVIHEESNMFKSKGFFYVYKPMFVVKLVYDNVFFEGDYAMETCNAIGCVRKDFLHYDRQNLPARRPGGELDFNGTLNGRFLAHDTSTSAKSRSSASQERGWLIAVVFMSAGFCMLAIGLTFFYVRVRRGKRYRRAGIGHHQHRANNRRFGDGPVIRGASANGTSVGGGGGGRAAIRNGGLLLEPTSMQLSSYTSNAAYEPLLSASVPLVPRGSLEIVRSLGEGAFGQVSLAHCKLDLTSSSTDKSDESGSDSAESRGSLVAAKMMKRFCSDRSQEVAREAELMAKLDHPNIVTFYGVCVQADDDLLLLYEYMELGDLKKFLAQHGPHPELASDDYSLENSEQAWKLSETQLVEIARQVAEGLSYLHKNHFVHRDLACRNCLVKEPLTVKLSDFGMTRDIYSSDYYRLNHKAPLPVRWLPPESLLYGRFSNLSDIWSYGVVVWEIATYGKQPWYEYSNVEVMQRVNNGETLSAPDGCSDVLRDVMRSCWKRTPSERAKLTDIISRLERA